MEEMRKANKKRMVGTVVKNKMEKTVVVEIERSSKYPVYHKYITKKARYLAHDNENRCEVGEKVLIVETRPISKRKRWLVKEIIKGQGPILTEDEYIDEHIIDERDERIEEQETKDDTRTDQA